MPLVYTGHLAARPLTPGEALDRYGRRLAEATRGHRLDVFFAADRPLALEHAARHLPGGFDGYWMDVAGRASGDDLGRYLDWARDLRGGRMRLISHNRDRENDLVIGLGGPPLLRVDDEALDPLRADRRSPRAWLGYMEVGPHLEERPERLALGAARVRHAYALLDGLLGGGLEPFDAWWSAHFARRPGRRGEPVTGQAYEPRAPWAGPVGPAPDAPPATEIEIRSLDLDGVPFTLHVEVPAEHRGFLLRVHAAWLGLLDDLDVVELRCMDTLPRLWALSSGVKLGERERGTLNAYGVSSLHRSEGVEPSAAAALFEDAEIAGGLLEWGLRWSGLRWRLPGDEEAACLPDTGFYWVRGERQLVADDLRIHIDLDDPDDPRVRRCRQALAERIDPDVGHERGWQFESVPADSPAGRRYGTVATELRDVVAAVVAEAAPLPALRDPSLPVIRRWLDRALGRGGAEDAGAAFPEMARHAVAEALPGFVQDRTAHPTEAYFLDFVRATPSGFHYLQFVRTHPEPGHTVRLGVSLFRARLDELEPGPDRATHGIVLDLDALCPEVAPLVWSYQNRRELQAALTETLALVTARALPCFERAEAVLATAREQAGPATNGGDDAT